VPRAKGADGFAERARLELAAAGEQMGPGDRPFGHDLTAQERNIALLVSEGKSNVYIAA
jgi:DNA-binding CsgD family transcriptional regulator